MGVKLRELYHPRHRWVLRMLRLTCWSTGPAWGGGLAHIPGPGDIILAALYPYQPYGYKAELMGIRSG